MRPKRKPLYVYNDIDEISINYDLVKILKWPSQDYLTLNVPKSKFMVICCCQKVKALNSINIIFEGKPLVESDTFDYLGVRLDIHLSWTA